MQWMSRGTWIFVGALVVLGMGCGRLSFDQLDSGPDGAFGDATLDGPPTDVFVDGPSDARLVDAVSPGGISDYFSACTLEGDVWVTEDPLGDGTFAMTGDGLSIGVAGTSRGHDIWSFPGDPTSFDYSVPRALRDQPDTDFELEVKFDTGLTTTYQQQGVIIEEDGDDVIRLEFHSNGTTRVFISYVVAGLTNVVSNTSIAPLDTAPIWMRVRRRGDEWTLTWSTDGRSFQGDPTFTFTAAYDVMRVGVFAGNSPMVDNTVVVDYFRDTSEPFDAAADTPSTCP